MPTMRRSSPSRYSHSVGSSVRQTMRWGPQSLAVAGVSLLAVSLRQVPAVSVMVVPFQAGVHGKLTLELDPQRSNGGASCFRIDGGGHATGTSESLRIELAVKQIGDAE